jgi:hypothetical protein
MTRTMINLLICKPTSSFLSKDKNNNKKLIIIIQSILIFLINTFSVSNKLQKLVEGDLNV